MNAGVYQIRNTINDKRYIGSAVSLHTRLGTHKRELFKGKHINAKLQRAWAKSGAENFVFEKIIICSKEDLLMYEQIAIDGYDAVKNGYNISPVAGNTTGVKRTEDAKRRISIARTGSKASDETRAKLSAASSGRKHSEETKAQMSKNQTERRLSLIEENNFSWSFLGHNHTDEAKAKVSAANKGRVHTAETRAKVSAASKGRKQTDEDKKKKSIARKAWWDNPENRERGLDGLKKGWIARASGDKAVVTPETRAKISAAGRGRKQSPEHVAKRMATKAATLAAKALTLSESA